MIVTFVYPSSPQYTGGVVTIYQYANSLARRGHEVHFVHGPANPYRISSLDELSWFAFEPSIRHHVVDGLDDPSLPEADVVMSKDLPRRLGLPASLVQGHWMVPPEMEAQVFRSPGLTVCVASWLTRIGTTYGLDDSQLVFVPQGMDHDLFRPVQPLDQRPLDVAILFNRHPAKGWAVARKTLDLVREKLPDLRATVFGILPPDDDLPDWLPFFQGSDREALARDVYNEAKVLLQTSWYEGFGLTAIEAMACGCALVTTDNGGSDDYALPGRTAEVAAPGDAEGLAAHVVDLLDDPARRITIAGAGERHVRRFDWDRSAELLEGHLERYCTDPEPFLRPPGPDRPADRVRPR